MRSLTKNDCIIALISLALGTSASAEGSQQANAQQIPDRAQQILSVAVAGGVHPHHNSAFAALVGRTFGHGWRAGNWSFGPGHTYDIITAFCGPNGARQ